MFLVEGNLGAGKSTLLALIQQYLPHINVVFEPVNSWHSDNHGASLLSQFYCDQQRWSYTMEKQTLLTRVKEFLKEQQDPENKIMERSIYSGYYCFAKNGYLQGNMTDQEWHAYNLWFDFLVTQKCNKPSGFIYLRTSPETCYQRINKRARSGEEIIPLSYLQEIHAAHESFLIKKENLFEQLVSVPVLVLDAEDDFENNQNKLKHYLTLINDFVINFSKTTNISLKRAFDSQVTL